MSGLTTGPLTGVTVLDLCHFLAGPYATLVLADLGADVIKVEDPDHPDEAREIGPHFYGGESLYYLSLNWAKRSVAVRLSTGPGRRVFHDLVTAADVVVDNYRPGIMRKLGLDHESLAAINPEIVTCSITGFGETGPYSSRPGYDYTIQALSGVMSLTGDPDRSPGKAGISYVDHSGGLAAALGVVAALLERTRTNEGRHIDIGLLDVQISMLTYLSAWWLNTGAEPQRTPDASHPSIVPAQNFAGADGYLSVFVGNDAMWRRLVHALNEPDLRDNRFATVRDRGQHRNELISRLSSVFARAPVVEWVELLTTHGVPCAPVNSLSRALRDEQVVARSLVAESTHSTCRRYEHVRGPLPAIASSGDRGAPLLGEHTREVLRSLGYSEVQLDGLVGRGVVACAEAAETSPAQPG